LDLLIFEVVYLSLGMFSLYVVESLSSVVTAIVEKLRATE